ncbi:MULTISPECIES: Nif11-like leader peptide family RiPP precursor [Anoxynatronum]|uniref:Nif11-like leader peptide domain-containing protein n=2 Tax=Anoxynatronum TaxID=210622 RepID=A0AA46AJ86_9CLOT|nr:Nif11-like leader peptide family RiPP precursor [Anoxynatronum buryatiense]SMP57994.1 nif11-like leader peptide domain-containing protein [Anoxynatronum buryatiense]
MEERMMLLKQKLEADEQLVEKLMQQETPEEVQALLKENGVDLTIEEINTVREALLKAMERSEEGELSEEDLEEVTGGVFLISMILAIACAAGLTQLTMSANGKRW